VGISKLLDEDDLALGRPAVVSGPDRHGLEGDEGRFILELPPAVLR
jgi:hypothetical protein